jgi:2-amino-4-hydroxy-6-hydroxymethyldihydropteridine diphosphokinase
MHKVLISLGSNLGDRLANLHLAVSLMSQRYIINNIVCSKIYETRALVPENSPGDWDKDFLNMAAMGDTNLSPKELINGFNKIQRKISSGVRKQLWGPRNIDIDILLYDDIEVKENDLIIPHKEMLNRDFVLIPSAEIAGNWIYPNGIYAQKNLAEISRLRQEVNPTFIKGVLVYENQL